jgi:hypothetical protein
MADQWPPTAPGVNKAFKKAHDATNDNVPPPPALPIVTKKEIEELEQQRKKAASQLNLHPPGMKPKPAWDQKREGDLARRKERLQKPKDKARDDFERSR